MSFSTGTFSRIYDIGSIQTLKAISWTGEGVVKVRYRIANTETQLSSTVFVGTDTDSFAGSTLSSKFQISKDDLNVSTGNALVISGLVDSIGQNLKFLPDAYGGEIKTVDSLGESFTVSALMQLSIPESTVGGRAYVAVKSDDGYGQEIRVQKRLEKSNVPNVDGFQEVFNGANIEVDGYSYPIVINTSEVRLTEAYKSNEKTVEGLIVSEPITRNAFNEFVTSLPVKSLVDAYGSIEYNIDSNDTDFLLTRDVVSDEVNLLNARIETLNYESLSNEWVSADVDYKWTAEMFLERGTYLYNFLVTRRKPSGITQTIEIQDPRNSEIITDDFGKTYSKLIITEPSLITFTLFTAAEKVCVVGSFNDFVEDKDLLQVGTDTMSVTRMLKGNSLYTNNHKDWNRVDFYLNKSVFVDRIRFETEAAEDERQKILILLDDKPVSLEEYQYTSGRDLSAFETLPIPTVPVKTVLSEFDQGFDDVPDAYGYIDPDGYVDDILLQEVLTASEDGYGLTTEEKYVNWRYSVTPSFSTDAEGAFNAIRVATEYFNIAPSTTQITLREAPSIEDVQIIRADSFTIPVSNFTITDFDRSNRVITISPVLERGIYRVAYRTIIYGGKLINGTVLEDAMGNRYKYISGIPATGAIVEIEEIINIVIESERETFQLSHFPSGAITIETLGSYARKIQIGITVNDQTLNLNSYLNKGTYVVFYTNVVGTKCAQVFVLKNVFNSISLIDVPDETEDIEIYVAEVPAQEKLNVISINGRDVTFNSPSQEAVYEVIYKVRDFNPTLGDSVWISEEDGYGDGYGYGEWNYRDGYGYGAEGYGSDRVKVQKVSLLSRYDSFSGNARKHKSFSIYTNEGLAETFTDFSLRYKDHFEAYLIPHSLRDPQSRTNDFPRTVEYVTIAGADGIWQLPVTLYAQENRISAKSEYFNEAGETISSEDAVYPQELFEEQNPSIVTCTVPEPYVEPFVNLNGSSETSLTVTYGTERYFLANIFDITEAEDGYGTFETEDEIVRINDNEWQFRRWTGTEYVIDYILNKETLTVVAVNESGCATNPFTFTYKEPISSTATPYTNFTTLPAEDAQFTIGETVTLSVTNIPDKIRLNDLTELQIAFFVGENNAAPERIYANVNNYGTVQLIPDQQVDAYGELVFDGYGVVTTYSTDLRGYFSSQNVAENEILQTLDFTFTATSEQMVAGKTSLMATYQRTSSICEVLVNGILKYKSPITVNAVDFDSYSIIVTEQRFAVLCRGETVYNGEVSSLTNPYIVLGASPREYDQNIQAKFGLYDLRRYMLVPQNLNVIGRYAEAEVTIDDYDDTESKLTGLDFVIEYDQPQFPKRPKIVDI